MRIRNMYKFQSVSPFMIIPIVVGVILLLLLQKFGIYSFIISSFVAGFLSKKMIKGTIVGFVVWGVGIVLIHFTLNPSITAAFLIPKVSSIRIPILCGVSGLVGGLTYGIFR